MLRHIPIAAQVIALVALAVLITSGAMIAISLGGPPPRDPPHRIAEIVDTLQGRGTPRPGPRIEHVEDLTFPVDGLRNNSALTSLITRDLGEKPGRVHALTELPVMPAHGEILGDFMVARQTADGGWDVVRQDNQTISRWQQVTVLTILAVALVTLGLAWLAARRITRPIEELGRAARKARIGARWRLDAPRGPPEIAAAAQALSDLHDRNLEHAEEQMTMLAAITHDIGTPLSRLAFRIDRLPEAQRNAAMHDIVTIRSLLADSRTLATGAFGQAQLLDFAELCRGVVARERDTGRDVSMNDATPCLVTGTPLALERMVQNLLDNALRYGSTARLCVASADNSVQLDVYDNGPGFPDQAEKLLRPFIRGDASRNFETGGSGLGLAIVAKVVEQHGGTIALRNHPEGGALVRVTIPLS